MKPRSVVTLVAVLLVAFAARLVWLSDEFNINEPDEILHVIMAENFAQGATYPLYDYSPYPDGFLLVPPLPLYAAGLVFRLFGASLRAFRAMSLVFGMAGIVAFYLLSGLYLKGLPRAVALAVFALSPVALYESSAAMVGAPAVLFLMLALWAYVRFTRGGRRGDLLLCAVFVGATAACKQYGVLLGGLIAVHWCARRALRGGPGLRGLCALLGIALGTFCLLAPWVLWRPRDSVHFYLYQTVVVQIREFLRGTRGRGAPGSLPYPEMVLAHALVALLGLVAFLATWRKRWDPLAAYAVLLALPIAVVREVRYLGMALPAAALLVGYLVAAVGELTAGRSKLARAANWALAVLLVVSVLPTAVRPWRVRSGLTMACRYVAAHTQPHELVMANYWRPVVERYAERRMPRDWLDAEARRAIARGEISYVILDQSQYSLRVLHTEERARVIAWVRASYEPVERFPAGDGRATEVYWTAHAAPRSP